MKWWIDTFRKQAKRVDHDFLRNRTGEKHPLWKRMFMPTKMDNTGFNALMVFAGAVALVSHYIIRPQLQAAKESHMARVAERQ
jgi:hypothetical protein